LDSIDVNVTCFVLISRPTQPPSPSEYEGVIPSPDPSVLASHHSSVTRPASRRSIPNTPPQTLELWLESRVMSSPIEVTSNHDSFDVYIDEVRFIPDNATIIKVNDMLIPFIKDKGNPLLLIMTKSGKGFGLLEMSITK